MKHFYFHIITLISLSLFVASCQKTAETILTDQQDDPLAEIFLVVDDDQITAETKTTAVTAVPSTLYWGATTGSGSSEATKWGASSASVSSSTKKINTGKYQTYSPTTYNYYVSNVNFTVGANTSMSASNATDIVVGRTSTDSTTPSVELQHIFARTGTFTMNTQSGYTISNVSWKISGAGTAGTYNLRTGAGATDGTGWSSLTPLSETTITSSSDLYVVPGSYTIKCTYTLTKGDWSNTFTKSATVNLVGGKVNNITGTATGGAATEIVITVSLAAWGTQNHTPTFS
jgi:hypothetical protein